MNDLKLVLVTFALRFHSIPANNSRLNLWKVPIEDDIDGTIGRIFGSESEVDAKDIDRSVSRNFRIFDAEVKKRIGMMYIANNKFDKVTFGNKHLRLKKKLEMFVCMVIPAGL